MSKVRQSTTLTNRRRFLRLAASTAAATALLAAPALANTRDDKRLLATIAEARATVRHYTETGERSHACYELVQADPDKPHGGPVDFAAVERENGSPLSERALMRLWYERKDAIYRRHGYDTASDEWNATGDRLRSLLRRICATRPRTVEGASAKAALFSAALEADCWDTEDLAEYGLPVLVADLGRLTKGDAA
jgi:hypothetical protein